MANSVKIASWACNLQARKPILLFILWQTSPKQALGHVKSMVKERFLSENYGKFP
jgi:hypothetical protein